MPHGVAVPTATLRGERVLLEPLTVGAAGEMVGVLSSPLLYLHTGGSPPSLAELTARYARQVAGPADADEAWLNWVVRGEGVAVGYVQATVRQEAGGVAAAVAWVVRPEAQGRGVATDAARAVVAHLLAHGVDEVTALVSDANVASVAVARRLGMQWTDVQVEGERRWRLRPPPARRQPRPS